MKHFYYLYFILLIRFLFCCWGLEYHCLLHHEYFIFLFVGTLFSQEARAWITQQDGADGQSGCIINERS